MPMNPWRLFSRKAPKRTTPEERMEKAATPPTAGTKARVTQATDADSWKDANWRAQGQFRRRSYQSYQEYLHHQAAKLGTIKSLNEHHQRLREQLRNRLMQVPGLDRGATVLCLGARSGAECESFIDLGCVAIGIDLNPGTANRFVVTGDFHRVQYADASFDVVFTNALDHVFDLDVVLGEVTRLLKPRGLFIAEIVRGSKDEGGREPGGYESLWWDHVDQAIETIARRGLECVRRNRFSTPWGGDQVVFVKDGPRPAPASAAPVSQCLGAS